MRSFNLLFLFLLSFSFCQAQTVFIRGYGGPADFDRFFHANEAMDGGYIFSGLTQSFGAGDRDGILMKTDAAGNITWAYNYGNSSKNEYFFCTAEAPDSSIYAFGVQTQTGAKEHMILARFESSGQFDWEKRIGGMSVSGYDEQSRQMIYYDNHLYLFGSSQDNTNMALDNGYVLKFDLAGNMVWANVYGENGREQIRDAALGAGGNFKCAGFINSIGAGDMDFMMSEIDSSGNLTWMKSYGTPNFEWADANLELSDGSLLAGGFRITNGQEDIFLIRTSASGTLLWAKSFGGSDDDRCHDLVELSNGNIGIVGYSKSFGTGDKNAILMTITPQGQVISGALYGGTLDETIFNSILLNDQTLLLSGWSNSPGYTHGQEDFMAIKVPQSGSFEKFCTYRPITSMIQDSVIQIQVDSAGRQEPSFLLQGLLLDYVQVNPADTMVCFRSVSIENDFPGTLQIYPNPVGQVLNVTLPEDNSPHYDFVIYDLLGKEIMRSSLSSQSSKSSIDVGILPKGLYLLSLQNNKGDSWIGKWIKD